MKIKDIIYLIVSIIIVWTALKLLPELYAIFISLGSIVVFMFVCYTVEIIVNNRRWKKTWDKEI